MKTVAQKKDQKKRSARKSVKSIFKKQKKNPKSNISEMKSNEKTENQKSYLEHEAEHAIITNEDEQHQVTNIIKSYEMQGEQYLIRRIRVGSFF